MSRVWVYPRGRWSGRLPSIGDDEYGRRTLVLPIPFGPTVVVVVYTCRCEGCDLVREETARFEADQADTPDC